MIKLQFKQRFWYWILKKFPYTEQHNVGNRRLLKAMIGPYDTTVLFRNTEIPDAYSRERALHCAYGS